MQDPPNTCYASSVCGFSRFRVQCVFEASGWFQDGPGMPHERPRKAPMRSQNRRGAPQEHPKIAQCVDFLSSGGAGRMRSPSLFDVVQDCPRRASEAPKTARGGPQEGSGESQNEPKRTPAWDQETSTRPQNANPRKHSWMNRVIVEAVVTLALRDPPPPPPHFPLPPDPPNSHSPNPPPSPQQTPTSRAPSAPTGSR